MRKTIIAIAISFAAAFAAASWIYMADRGPKEAAGSPEVGSSFDSGLPVEDRIAALERAVSDERFARQLLQEEVFYLTVELQQLAGTSDFDLPEEISADASDDESRESPRSRREEYRRRNSPEGRIERLIEAGFLPSQASMIVRRPRPALASRREPAPHLSPRAGHYVKRIPASKRKATSRSF